jgi:hypothetical protein
MKMEDHFKETLKRAVANEPPELDAWSRFERRMHRGRNVRLFVPIAAAAAVIVAGVIAVPKLFFRTEAIPVLTSPTPTPASPSPSPDPYAGWNYSRNAGDLWQVYYPKSWYGQMAPLPIFEGVASLQPPDVEPIEKGLPTFAVSIRFDQGSDPGRPPSGEPTPAARETVARDDGRTEYRTEHDKDGMHVIVYQLAWTACAAGEPDCREVDGTLVVRVLASNEALWNKYGETGDLIARSIRAIDYGPIRATETP